MYKFLVDENELRNFFDFYLPTNWLGPTECLFLSLAARNKYQKDRAKSDVNLNKTFMFDRTLITGKDLHRLWNNLIVGLRKLERNEGAYKVKAKSNNEMLLDIPNDCMMVYFNINPANSINALLQLKDRINLIESELWKASVNGNSIENCILDVNRLHHIAEECYGKAKSKTRWFDIDVDIADEPEDVPSDGWIKTICESFCHSFDPNIDYNNLFIIRTYGGFHICFKVDICKSKKIAPHECVDIFNNLITNQAKCSVKEIKLNDNGIIPLPGTMQSTHLVRFIKL